MESEKIVEVIKAVVPTEKAYDDLASPSLRETSEVLVSVVKTARIAFLPFELGAHVYEKLAGHLKRAFDQVPEERQIKPHPQIAGPVLEGLRYVPDTDLMARLFENLLARAIDKERVGEAHPAFAGIIGQLSPDEAVMLYFLKGTGFQVTEEIDPNSASVRVGQIGADVSEVPEFPTDELMYPEHFEMYWKRLVSLTLCSVKMLGGLEGVRKGPDGFREGIWVDCGLCHLSDFGRLFAKACVPDSLLEKVR